MFDKLCTLSSLSRGTNLLNFATPSLYPTVGVIGGSSQDQVLRFDRLQSGTVDNRHLRKSLSKLVNPIRSPTLSLARQSIYNLCFLAPLAILENSAWGMPAMNLSKPPKASATCNFQSVKKFSHY
jgi:hypothetical protein